MYSIVGGILHPEGANAPVCVGGESGMGVSNNEW